MLSLLGRQSVRVHMGHRTKNLFRMSLSQPEMIAHIRAWPGEYPGRHFIGTHGWVYQGTISA